MTILLGIFLVSCVAMIIMLAVKIRNIRREETVQHAHVGLATVFRPLYERVTEIMRVAAGKVYSFVYPIVAFAMYKGGLVLHTASVRIGKKFLGIADTIKGRGVLKRRGDAPMFLRDIIEHQRALRGKLEV